MEVGRPQLVLSHRPLGEWLRFATGSAVGNSGNTRNAISSSDDLAFLEGVAILKAGSGINLLGYPIKNWND